MRKVYKGVLPDLTNWQLMGVIKIDSVGWAVFKKNSQGIWSNYKIVSSKPTNSKANYLLAWNGERFSKSHCHDAIVQHRNELFNKFCELAGIEL